MPQKTFILLALLASTLFAQGPASGPDAAVLTRLLERHRPAANQRFDFAAIGDQQYGPAGERQWPALVTSINNAASGLQFIVHTGDVKSGSTLCDNAMFANRVTSFNAFTIPMIITPGDNEWTDCHRENNGSYDSLERLAYLRNMFYPNNQSFGQRKLTLSQQSEDRRYSTYVENSLWSQGNVLFATIHIIGSNNNLGRNAANDREYRERTDANFNWIKTIFSVARDSGFSGVVLVIQANPGFYGPRVRTTQMEEGFRESFFVLEDEIITYARPVLLIHGDSHEFHYDKPWLGARSGSFIGNVTRLEVPGSADVHWVRVTVDPAKPALFGIDHVDVPANWPVQTRP